MSQNFVLAILMTFLAGLATTVGGMLTFFIKRSNVKALSIGLGFSAGVMIFISFTEILQSSKDLLAEHFSNTHALWLSFFGFAAGVLVAILIDYFMPDHIEEDIFDVDNNTAQYSQKHRVKRAGLLTAVAICIHNFPEGIATFFVANQSLTLGITVAFAIALHNIPEGIAVALPIYHATGKKRLAVLYSFLSGISEPIGAIIGFFILNLFMPQYAVGFMFAAVAGIMVYISFDTLLPLSREYGDGHYSVFGIMSGIFVIWLSLLFLS